MLRLLSVLAVEAAQCPCSYVETAQCPCSYVETAQCPCSYVEAAQCPCARMLRDCSVSLLVC